MMKHAPHIQAPEGNHRGQKYPPKHENHGTSTILLIMKKHASPPGPEASGYRQTHR